MAAPAAWFRSRALQILGVIVAFILVAFWHRNGDGLWFQGDAPRHAMNGLFWWDLVRAMPSDPFAYALSYYARYPVIAPATYPPLFYLLEGAAFAAFGPSPGVARQLVLGFAIAAGVYTLAYVRTRINPALGWAAILLAFVPGFIVWSNSVMLNVPATALGLAALYHFRSWLETQRMTQAAVAMALLAAVFVTYYPAISVLPVLAVWAVVGMRHRRPSGSAIWWVAGGVVLAVLPVLGVLFLTPVHTSRNFPSLVLLRTPATWTYYWRALPDILGFPLLCLGSAGCVAGLLNARWRREAGFVVMWIVMLIVGVSVLPAREPRYILLTAPAFVIGAAIAFECVALVLRRPVYLWSGVAMAVAGTAWSAASVRIPQVSGFREIALYLRDHGPTDTVLYDGNYDGLFGFYVRALDSRFERRIVLANKLLYQFGPGSTFQWTMHSDVASTEDVVNFVRSRCGCRWIAVEVGPHLRGVRPSRLLREALQRPEFERVRSFPIAGAGDRTVELYRTVFDVQPIGALDLKFPSLSDRVFRQVVPVSR